MSADRIVNFDSKLLSHIQCGRNKEAQSVINQDLTQVSDSFGTLLHHAAACGNQAIIRHLMNLGSAVDSHGKNSRTPLAVAVQSGKPVAVKLLLQAGADIDVVDAEGTSPLQIAIRTCDSNANIARAFVHKIRTRRHTIAELVDKLTKAGCTLHHAVYMKDIQIAEALLQRGSDVNSKNDNGKTALDIATQIDDHTLAKLLIDRGARIDACDGNLFYHAACHANSAMLQLLIESEARSITGNNRVFRYAPLFALYAERHTDDVKRLDAWAAILLQHGAMPENACYVKLILDRASFRRGANGVDDLVAHLALVGSPTVAAITESIRYEYEMWKVEKLKELYRICRRTLKVVAFDELTLLNLLTDCEYKMRHRVRQETFVTKVEEFCAKLELKEFYFYYYDTLMKRVGKARHAVDLEEEAISVICEIFQKNENECYLPARRIFDYLSDCDLEQLCKV